MLSEVAAKAGVPLPMARVTPPGRPLAGLTVLVVEDSRYSSEAMRLLCMRSGARIRRADCLRSAFRHLQAYRPDVAIIDLGLPDGDGADLIRDLALATPRVAAIVGISGDPSLHNTVFAAGADGFLAKPVESVAIFQHAVMSALPANLRSWRPTAVSDDMIQPDNASLREDLAYVAEILSRASDTNCIGYVARFLCGVARSAHDEPLQEAALTLADDLRKGHAITAGLAGISAMVEDRLA